jgi:hypothetical protein
MRGSALAVALAAVLLIVASASAQDEVPRMVEDRYFFTFPFQRNGEPMPLEQLQRQPSGNIVLVDFNDPAQLVVQVQGQFQPQDQLGVNLDPDQDGQGDQWLFIDNLAQNEVGFVTDAYFVVLGELQFERPNESTVVIHMAELAERYRLHDCHGEFDPALIVVTFNREISELDVVTVGSDQPELGQFGQFQIGEPIEMVQVNSPVQDSPAHGFLIESQQQQQQQQMLKDKYCPPKNPLPMWFFDADGGGMQDDYYFYRNTQAHGWGRSYLRIELWCLNSSAFGKHITEGGGRAGWIGKCPYAGGRNFQQKIDFDGDGVPDIIRRMIVDGGGDDDGDGDLDITMYEYDVNRGLHMAMQFEIEDFYTTGLKPVVMIGDKKHYGPYGIFSDLPGPYSFPDPTP